MLLSTNRSAEAGILGFTYQFLQTAIKILETDDLDTSFTIEGIEDLDILTAKEEELVQYKYHEAKKYTPSQIQKPIALMFKHFIDNYREDKEWKIKYTLFSYFGLSESEPSMHIKTTEDLNKILNYSEAKEILEDKTWTTESEEKFLENLIITKADKFEDAYRKLIGLIVNTFNVSEIESEVGYLTNAIFCINKLAIIKDINSRKITKRQYVDYLLKNSRRNEAAIIERLYGKAKYISTIKGYLRIKNVKPNTKSHIFYLASINHNTSRFILDLVKKFFVPGKKKDIKPITLVINSEETRLKKLKEELSRITVTENLNLIFNDGDEDYYFNDVFFNSPPFIILQRNMQKIESMSYNYKLISYKTYESCQEKIIFDNPIHIFIDDSEAYSSLKNYSTMDKVILNNLNEQDILQIFGG